jgi:hypothetical protein
MQHTIWIPFLDMASRRTSFICAAQRSQSQIQSHRSQSTGPEERFSTSSGPRCQGLMRISFQGQIQPFKTNSTCQLDWLQGFAEDHRPWTPFTIRAISNYRRLTRLTRIERTLASISHRRISRRRKTNSLWPPQRMSLGIVLSLVGPPAPTSKK